MKIGIMSDSHKRVGRSQRVIELLKKHGATQIIRAGDIVKQEVLDLLEASGLPYIAVFGNNDAHLYHLQNQYNLVEEPYHFTLGDLTASLMHHPHYVSLDRDIMIYGHTHDFLTHYEKGTLILNPGESCARDKPLSECMLLDISEKEYTITYFHRTIKSDKWKKKRIVYKREKVAYDKS